MQTWIRPHDPSGLNNGINDGSIYTFKERKYESLAREPLQNSMDERLSEAEPVTVEFSLFQYPTDEIPGIECYRKLYEDSLHYWKDNHQENAKIFFEQALSVLSSKEIPILRISDFNTKGVKGSGVTAIETSRDITPWYNLIKSEGSSSKGDTQGGSFGIGKNATYAASSLRTVLYSTYDEDGVKAHEGLAKLASIFQDGKAYAAKAFYGESHGEQTRAIKEVLNLDPGFSRSSYGTDLFVLGFEVEEDWSIRMMISILSDFFLPIHEKHLEVILDGERIHHGNLKEIFTKYMELAEEYKLPANLRHELRYARNYFEVAISEKTQIFIREYDHLGKAVLRVLYDPEFDRKVMRTRKTGMKLFTHGHISSSIGFSGILSLEGEELNKLFRKMENPAHTAWSADNIDVPKDKKTAKTTLSDLNRWIKETINDNAYDKTLEAQEVEGLGAYLPSLLEDPKEEGDTKKEVISDKVQDITKYRSTREELMKIRQEALEEATGKGAEEGEEEGGGFSGEKDRSKEKGGQGGVHGGNIQPEGESAVLRTVPTKFYTSRLMRSDKGLILVVTSSKDLENTQLLLSVSGETSKEELTLTRAVHRETLVEYSIVNHRIHLGKILKGTKVPLLIEMKKPESYALEVKLYEHQTQ